MDDPVSNSLGRPRPRGAWAVLGLSLLLACQEGGGPAAIGVAGKRSEGLIFVREVGRQADLARARIGDGAVAVVSRTPHREERWPYWSEAARRVVFQARPYGPHSETHLVLWDPESGEERVLASKPARDYRWPTWSPVSSRLAYAFKQPRGPAGVVLYDLATERSEVVSRIAFPGFFLRPSFSPDGRRLVVQRRAGRSVETDLWLVESGQPPRRITSRPGAIDTKARFTTDGRAVLFTRRLEQQGPGDLFRIDLESGIETRYASLPTADDHSAWPSPTRDEIAFISDRDGSQDVFLLALADGQPRNLTRSPEIDEAAPLWSPDGERLAILRRPQSEAGSRPVAAETHVAVIDREGRTLFGTQGMMADWMPAWPDGGGR
jgi:dipeptidyl aminopeptidase/acylaminoacyl peptidase